MLALALAMLPELARTSQPLLSMASAIEMATAGADQPAGCSNRHPERQQREPSLHWWGVRMPHKKPRAHSFARLWSRLMAVICVAAGLDVLVLAFWGVAACERWCRMRSRTRSAFSCSRILAIRKRSVR